MIINTFQVRLCAAFPLKCPEPAQWSTRARGHCLDPSKYFCLKNDLINGYSENCTIFDFLQPGRKNVLRGGLDADICSSERYQPWPIKFYTNVSTNCIFLKSTCNEEGQVIYGNGNRNTDITCRCDYNRGYDFVVKPRNPCFCVPSEEDCSCYLKMCQDSRYVLSPVPRRQTTRGPNDNIRVKISLLRARGDWTEKPPLFTQTSVKQQKKNLNYLYCGDDTSLLIPEVEGIPFDDKSEPRKLFNTPL
ncbi:unnamed protein product [Mytilus coruscus]|uniref:Uncharacterized protein n=1 Tax=Mytilus coruscus TaxID=42192 RepID=A0A6J8BZC7_MYTCO|nr:unnamed protein product [Mytilus coruscus]